jgi:sigma-B regulation protein RsbU (phosphoserine phosphatase)
MTHFRLDLKQRLISGFSTPTQSLSFRLGILIVLIIAVGFTLLFGYLFYRGKRYIQYAAIEHATQLLDNTAERINGIMDETETVTNYMALTTPRHLTPDSLLVFTRRAIEENSFLTGMAISMEPNFFPEMGRYFSAYSLRYRPNDNDVSIDSITTVREGPFEYFDAVWYKTPRSLGTPCWVDAYDDYNEGTLSSPDILSSYCCPMRDASGRYVGSITASLTLKWLSQAFSGLKPYPNSSAIMIDRTGTYIVHPDTTKLFRESIFSDAAPEVRNEIEALGKDMLAGHSGMVETTVDGKDAFIFYRPLERTGWSLAIVCPESDIFARYNHLVNIVWSIIIISLLLLMLFCYQTVRKAVQPLKQLDQTTRRIADGHFDEPLPESSRHDSIGRLTNSFVRMQQSLAKSVADIRRVNMELEKQNDELANAYQLKMETNRQKTAFVQDMYHEIRTPLNIISGFAQVLYASSHTLPAEEVNDITTRMQASANDINLLTQKLYELSKPPHTT